jgi:glycerophosphoryl diester phosphodiesterase
LTTLHPFLDHSAPIAFAHRGGAGESPENTLAAFQHAYDLGYRYLETDVHATSDGMLMAFHDEDLERTCGVRARIGELTYDEVRRLRVDEREAIPTLDEVAFTWSDVRVNIDCKSDEAVEPLEKFLRHDATRQRVCIGSFSDRRLDHLRTRFGQSLCTSMGPREVATFRLLGRRLAKRHIVHALAAQVPVSAGPVPLVTERFVERSHLLGIHVHVWTIDEPAMMQYLLDLGVDGIMTDQPSILKSVLQERDEWRIPS